jgi:2-oxo-4-hydroxy-4-carboxy--5-ureidoimidazoline (OHCU) decarboxylase
MFRPRIKSDIICFDFFFLFISEKQTILQLYPDLVAKLTDLSKFMLHIEQYQRISGADRLTIEDKQKLGELNKL